MAGITLAARARLRHLLGFGIAALCALPLQAQLRYDTEYPVIGYGKTMPTDAFTRLMVGRGLDGSWLQNDAIRSGYLESLLEALDIDPASQVLVFSKTSLKQRFITPENPRSLFFNDEVYVGFVPGSSTLEIGAMDPNQGPVFFDFHQAADAPLRFEQETSRCLRCHDSYSLTGGGVPRFMLSSVVAGADGNLVSHELSEMTTTATPIAHRWGGFYVTGTVGDFAHRGNMIITDVAVLRNPEWTGAGTLAELDGFANLDKYPRTSSDIVALLVLEHQVEVQNLITRLNYESRMALENGALDAATLDTLAQPLLDALFMAHEAPLAGKVEGNTEYAANFAKRGPFDSQGRSLREFDLETRTFKYPLSYLIYSPAIDALAEPVRAHLFGRIEAVLENAADAPAYEHLSTDQRSAILAILRETKPEVLQ